MDVGEARIYTKRFGAGAGQLTLLSGRPPRQTLSKRGYMENNHAN